METFFRNGIQSVVDVISSAKLLGSEPSPNSQNSTDPHDSQHDIQTPSLPQLLQTVTGPQAIPLTPKIAKRHLPNSDATRLLGDFSIPGDAQRISFPAAENQDWEGVDLARAKNKEEMARDKKVGSGLHRAINTLDQPAIGGLKSKHLGQPTKAQTLPPPPPPPPQDRFRLSSRNTAPSVEADPVEEFANRRDRKRQKFNTDHGHAGMMSDPISFDEVSDDGSQGKLVGLNGRQIPRRTRGPSRNGTLGRRAAPWGFAPFHLDKVLTRLEVGSEKRSFNGRRAGYGSQETMSDTMSSVGDFRPNPKGAKRQVSHVEVTIDDDAKSPGQRLLQVPKSTATRSTTLAPKDPRDGIARNDQKSMLRDGQRRIENERRPSYGAGPLGTTPREVGAKPKSTNKRTIHQDMDDSTLRSHDFEGVRAGRGSSPLLSERFKRDDGQLTTQREVTKEPECPALPASIPIDVDGEQDDMLTGGSTTVNSRRQNISLARRREKSPAKVTKDNAAADRSPSPSNLKETPFRGLSKQRAAGAEHQPSNAQEEKTTSPDEILVDLYWRLFCGTEVVLVWDQKKSCFYIRDKQKLVTAQGSPTPVSIRSREVKKWYYNDDVSAALIKASHSPTSGGLILIQFRSTDDLHRCHNFWVDDVETVTETAERMAQVVKQQKADLQHAFQKYMSNPEKRCTAAVTDADEIAWMRTRQGRNNPVNDDGEERITYEDDSESPPRQQSTRRKQMLPSANRPLVRSNTGKLAQDSTQSRFFEKDIRRSGRQTRARENTPPPSPPIRWSHLHKPKRWKGPVIYPVEGKERVTVDFDDLERLDEGEFLNDNVIAFGIRRIQESMAPEHRDQVYFFNSFFYTMLMHKSGRKNFDYEAVKRWTKNKDIFSYPYIVVPINVNLHWFVAIICNLPNIVRGPDGLEDKFADIDEATKATQAQDPEADSSFVEVADSRDEVMQNNDGTLADWSTPADPMDTEVIQPEAIEIVDSRSQVMDLDTPEAPSLETDEPGTKANPESTEQEVMLLEERIELISQSSPGTGRKGKKRAPPPLRPLDPNAPAIISLDSFDLSRSAEIKNLKLYIQAEAQAKRDISVNVQELRGITAKGIPAQKNFSDCGVYLIRYIEEFAKDPRKFVTRVLTRQIDPEGDLAKFDPAAKRAEIRDELLKLANGSRKS